MGAIGQFFSGAWKNIKKTWREFTETSFIRFWKGIGNSLGNWGQNILAGQELAGSKAGKEGKWFDTFIGQWSDQIKTIAMALANSIRDLAKKGTLDRTMDKTMKGATKAVRETKKADGLATGNAILQQASKLPVDAKSVPVSIAKGQTGRQAIVHASASQNRPAPNLERK